MKYFLATYEIIDGEHEHNGAVIFEAETAEQAYKMAGSEEHDPNTEYTDEEYAEGKFKYFDFGGDGTTASTCERVTEVTEAEAAFLQQVGVAYYFN